MLMEDVTPSWLCALPSRCSRARCAATLYAGGTGTIQFFFSNNSILFLFLLYIYLVVSDYQRQPQCRRSHQHQRYLLLRCHFQQYDLYSFSHVVHLLAINEMHSYPHYVLRERENHILTFVNLKFQTKFYTIIYRVLITKQLYENIKFLFQQISWLAFYNDARRRIKV